ncbi:hypothetical protein PMAYCL1PPCAC_09938, partial [Pristionchus mayeri]
MENGVNNNDIIEEQEETLLPTNRKDRHEELEKKVRLLERRLTLHVPPPKKKKPRGGMGTWALCFVLVIFMVIIMIVAAYNRTKAHQNPRNSTEPVKKRDNSVHLIKVNGRFGLVIKSKIIEEILPGGSADFQGHLKKGDEIVKINGQNIRHETSSKWLLDMFNKRNE